jgi:hypothetical protein
MNSFTAETFLIDNSSRVNKRFDNTTSSLFYKPSNSASKMYRSGDPVFTHSGIAQKPTVSGGDRKFVDSQMKNYLETMGFKNKNKKAQDSFKSLVYSPSSVQPEHEQYSKNRAELDSIKFASMF